MDKQSILFSILALIIATIILFIGLSYYSKAKKIRILDDNQLNTSYSVWLLGIILPFFIYSSVSIQLSETTIETIINTDSINDTFFQILYRLVIYFGVAIILSIASFYLIFKIVGIIFGGRSLFVELENSSTGLFIIIIIINVFFSFSILSPIKDFLNWYLPEVMTNYIH
ncbi:hypothetical protein [Flavobacterium stagni]|uniref:Uncharacterized protein n=1 Tax=Flavobacterium stagni TaxID=2506421 RepID=A0A4Q1K6N5_9FLAO|nr:hypothetical protein [Flavobacterium stagni]RXR21625.1 hypothetical protein EQG61_11480 [Flavobacterium stagni]